MILALAGGVGGARLANGLALRLAPHELVVAVNTGDDFEHLGLHIAPDLDTVMYTLAGRNDPERGWGLAGETWRFMDALEALGGDSWFRLGDRDLATHVVRTARSRAGETLSAVTADLCARLGVRHEVVPMSDGPVRTIVHTADGPLAFQDYFVRRRCEPAVTGFAFQGAAEAKPSPGLAAALARADLSAILICPSNPWLSILPILEIPTVRERLRARRAPLVAVSPIVGGQAVKGPAAKIMRELGVEASPIGIAEFYGDLLDGLVIDRVDGGLKGALEARALRVHATDTIMRDAAGQARLAGEVLELAAALRSDASGQAAGRDAHRLV